MTNETQILVNGKPVKKYIHNGKTYIEAKEGSEFSIKIKNNTLNRQLAIVSVDGLSVVDGEAPSDKSRGYIINAKSSVEIKGYRISDSEIASFKFVPRENGYAKSKGTPENSGGIGIRVFDEDHFYSVKEMVTDLLEPYHPYPTAPWHFPKITWDSSSTSSTTYSPGHPETILYRAEARGIESSVCATFKLATGWGKKQEDKIKETTFQPGNLAFSEDIFYTTTEELVKLGVPLTKESKISHPQTFPKWCSAPSGWNG